MTFLGLIQGSRGPRRRKEMGAGAALLRGVLVLAVLAGVGWLGISAYNGVPGQEYTEVNVEVPQVGNLLPHDPVRIAGVRVGQVRERSISERGTARVALQLDGDVNLPADTTVAVRANGLLGARYLQLIPGESKRILESGATITSENDVVSFGVTEALDTFDEQTRGGLGTMISETGRALVANGEPLNRALRSSSRVNDEFQALTGELLEDPGANSRLLPSLAAGTAPLDTYRRELTDLFGPTAVAMTPFSEHREATRRLLAEAPGALATANQGLSSGTRLLAATRELADAADSTLGHAPRALRETRSLLDGAEAPLEEAADLLDAAEPAVPGALEITGALQPALGPLREGIADLIPTMHEIGRHGCDIINTGVVFRSMTGFGGTGTGPNGPAMQFRLQAVPSPEENLGLASTNSKLIHLDGYPEPCKYLASEYDGQVYERSSGGGGE